MLSSRESYILLFILSPVVREVQVGIRTGWTSDRKISGFDAFGAVPEAGALSHLQIPPLPRHTEQLFVSVLRRSVSKCRSAWTDSVLGRDGGMPHLSSAGAC